MSEKKEKKEKPKLCGHVNKHSWQYNPETKESKLQDLICTLEAGHSGNHSAEKYEVRMSGGIAEEGTRAVFWTDDAGTPADEIEPDFSTLPARAREMMLTRQEEERRRKLLVQ